MANGVLEVLHWSISGLLKTPFMSLVIAADAVGTVFVPYLYLEAYLVVPLGLGYEDLRSVCDGVFEALLGFSTLTDLLALNADQGIYTFSNHLWFFLLGIGFWVYLDELFDNMNYEMMVHHQSVLMKYLSIVSSLVCQRLSTHSVPCILELLALPHRVGCQIYQAESRGSFFNSEGNHIKKVTGGESAVTTGCTNTLCPAALSIVLALGDPF
ncbi:hypothetical protein RIF29_03708 [Crotalaria pallida]|uniref:Uncharacterized protein n=1 Tax=Crotalaria pallida TaxID=3830 RepID=A0AAN9P9F9_CROPI